MRAALLLILLTHASLALADDAQRCRYVKLTTLAVTFEHGRPFVEGSINGKAARMLVDTGAYRTLLTRTAVEKFGLSTAHSSTTGAGVAGESIQYRAWVDKISIGPVSRDGINFTVLWEYPLPRTYAVLVGADFLFQRDLEIHLAAGQFTFFHPMGCDDAFLAYWDRKASFAILQEVSPRDPRRFVTVTINGQKFRALIDTGATHSLIDLAAAARAGVTPKSAGVVSTQGMPALRRRVIPQWAATFDRFEIGDEVIEHARLTMLDMWTAAIEDVHSPSATVYFQEQPEVVLGADFLRSHRVLFALSQRRLYFSYLGGKVFSTDPE